MSTNLIGLTSKNVININFIKCLTYRLKILNIRDTRSNPITAKTVIVSGSSSRSTFLAPGIF